jgi:hypothetical protein
VSINKHKKLQRVELSQIHGDLSTSMLFASSALPLHQAQKVSITPRHLQPNAATVPSRTPTAAGAGRSGLKTGEMKTAGSPSSASTPHGMPTGPTIIQIASPRNITSASPTYITRKVNVLSGDGIGRSGSSSNASSPTNNNAPSMMMKTTVTSASGKSVYLKRVSHGFYLHEEKLTWYDYLGHWWNNMSHSIRNISSPRHSPSNMSTTTASAPGVTHSITSRNNLNMQSNVSMNTNLESTHSGKKRIYRQRVEYNQDSGILKLAPLDTYSYPHSENVADWHPPISADVVPNDSNMNLLKWF